MSERARLNRCCLYYFSFRYLDKTRVARTRPLRLPLLSHMRRLQMLCCRDPPKPRAQAAQRIATLSPARERRQVGRRRHGDRTFARRDARRTAAVVVDARAAAKDLGGHVHINPIARAAAPSDGGGSDCGCRLVLASRRTLTTTPNRARLCSRRSSHFDTITRAAASSFCGGGRTAPRSAPRGRCASS